jgi:two-component system, chemotaxis family, protein-glutamate methylesterase/glutaminase
MKAPGAAAQATDADRSGSYRDVVVMGASAGGVEALRELFSSLPAEFPASIFVVLHLAASEPSAMASILDRAGGLGARTPEDGEEIERGQAYIAPPDSHMLLDDGRVRLTRGPRENGHRPAIDPLFRSAARAYGERVVAVLLSGNLDDGTAGMRLVKRSGGIAVVQDPDEARHSSMPRNAVELAEPQHVVPVAGVAPLLAELVEKQVGPAGEPEETSPAVEEEPLVSRGQNPVEGDPPGDLSGFICPECGGPLWELEDGPLVHFECKTGHAFSPAALEEKQGDALEAALWTALRSLNERSELLHRLARRGPERMSATRLERAEAVEAHAALVREAIARVGSTGRQRNGEPAEVD